MDSYLRRLAECEVDARDVNLDLERDPKITLPNLNPVTGPQETESSAQLAVGCRASLYDAIREMGEYEAVVEEERQRNDRGGFLHNPRGG